MFGCVLSACSYSEMERFLNGPTHRPAASLRAKSPPPAETPAVGNRLRALPSSSTAAGKRRPVSPSPSSPSSSLKSKAGKGAHSTVSAWSPGKGRTGSPLRERDGNRSHSPSLGDSMSSAVSISEYASREATGSSVFYSPTDRNVRCGTVCDALPYL